MTQPDTPVERRRDLHLQAAIARLEGKIDAMAAAQNQLRECTNGLDVRLRSVEVQVAGIDGRDTQAARAPQWPAVVSAVVAAAVALLALVALVYDKGTP